MSRNRRRSHKPRALTGAAPIAPQTHDASVQLRDPSQPATLDDLVDANIALSSSVQGRAPWPIISPTAQTSPTRYTGSSKPIPEMPQEKGDKPDLNVYGATGTANFSGIITNEDYNPDLLVPLERAAIFNEMRLSHAPVKALLMSLTQPLIRAEWSIQPGGTTDPTSLKDQSTGGDFDMPQQLSERQAARRQRASLRLTERQGLRRMLAEKPQMARYAEQQARARYHRHFADLADSGDDGDSGDDDAARNIEIAAFVQSCLFDDLLYETTEGHTLRQSWDDVLRHIVLLYAFGYSVFETIYRIEDGWTKWAKFTPLLPRTIYRWWVGADNELAGVQQWTFRNWTYEFVNIPASKLLTFVREREGSNFEGISVLRAAFKHYLYATTFEKIDAIAIERQSLVPPVIKLPEGFTGNDVTAAQNIVRNIRANEQLGIVIPNLWDFEFPRNQARYSAQALPAIQHHNTQILASGLMDWLGLGQGTSSTGSYALAEVRLKMIESAVQADAKLIEEVMNTAIRRLVDYNFEGVEDYPTLKCSKITMSDATMMAASLQQLAMAGLIHPSPDLESALLNSMGLPNAAPSQVEAQNPGSPATPDQSENPDTSGDNQESDLTAANPQQQAAAGGGPDAGGASAAMAETMSERRLAEAGPYSAAKGVPLATANNGANHTGIMVAFMLPADVAQSLADATDEAVPDGADVDAADPGDMHVTLAYLGDSTDPRWTPQEQQRLRDSVDEFAATQQPLTGKISRLGRFHNDGAAADAVHGKVTSRGLHTLRRALVDRLKADDFPVDETFPDYKPHVTLAYVPPSAPTPAIALPKADVPFTHATVAIGGAHSHHPLGTEQNGDDEPSVSSDGMTDAQLAEAVLAAIRGVDVVERAQAFALATTAGE